MADAKSNYAENLVLDWLLGGANPTRPSARYLALYTAAPGEAGGGTEVTGGPGPYARQTIAFNAASAGSATNSAQVQFLGMPAATVTHFAIYDAVTAGNELYYGALTASKTTTSGDTLTLPAGALTISEL